MDGFGSDAILAKARQAGTPVRPDRAAVPADANAAELIQDVSQLPSYSRKAGGTGL